jgi:hypothetical protein
LCVVASLHDIGDGDIQQRGEPAVDHRILHRRPVVAADRQVSGLSDRDKCVDVHALVKAATPGAASAVRGRFVT